MISILFTNNIPFNPFYGGIERVTDVLVRSLVNRGYKIFYLSSKCSNEDMLDYCFPVTQYILPNKKLHSIDNKNFYNDFLLKNKIQIVVNQRGLLLEGNFYIDNLPPDIKVVSCFHSKPFGYWEISKDVLFINHKRLVDKLKCVLKFVTYPLSLILLKKVEYRKTKKQLEYVVDRSDKTVFLSDNYIDLVLNRCRISKLNLLSIPNPNTYLNNQVYQVDKEKNVLFVGRLAFWDKRPETMLYIWEKVYKSFVDWNLYIVGHGELEDRLKKYVANHSLERVHFEGKQNPLPYYQTASILCMTSAYEGFPMVLTEAMQNGIVPVVFNSFGSSMDVINDGCNGILIPPFREEIYVENLAMLMRNDELRISMGKKARKSVQKFDIEKIVLNWEQLFHNLIKS